MGIATSSNHSMAWDSEGAVYTWGNGTQGQLGHDSQGIHDTSKIQYFPKKVNNIK